MFPMDSGVVNRKDTVKKKRDRERGGERERERERN
jgi:hypothetical protein